MKIKIATGEEALIWGAIKSNIGFISSLTDQFTKYASKIPLFQPPINQIVNNGEIAVERALGASFAGTRAVIFLDTYEFIKALNSIITVTLTGIFAGLVVIIRDDPEAWHLQTEHDSRVLIPFAGLPLMEPAFPQEGYSMMREAFRISEKFSMIVVIRITSNFLSLKEDIEIEETTFTQDISTDKNHFIVQAKNTHEVNERLLFKLQEVARIFNKSNFNKIIGDGKHKIIVSGPIIQKLFEVLGKNIEKDYSILKLGTVYPLPEKPLNFFLKQAKKILILEEKEPLIERLVKEKVQQYHLNISILGKETGTVPRFGELFKWQLEEVLSELNANFKSESLFFPYQEKKHTIDTESLCFGCSFIPIFKFMKEFLDHEKSPVLISDPGCAAKLAYKPDELMHIVNTHGAAIDIATGMAKIKQERRIIAITDDESFYHSGISSLIDACFSQANILLIILDTQRIASKRIDDKINEPYCKISIANIIKGLDIKFIRVIKPEDFTMFDVAYLEGLEYSGMGVIIIENKCTLIKYQNE